MQHRSFSTRVVLAAFASALSVGCGGLEPVGTYEGSASRSSEVSVLTEDTRPDGSGVMRSSRSTGSDHGVHVTVRRIDETHLELALGSYCTLRATQRPEPNQHMTDIEGGQRCRLDVPDFAGDVAVVGTASFSLDDPTALDVALNGDAERGPPDRTGHTRAVASYTFNGRRSAR